MVLHKKWKPAHRKQLYLLSLVPRDLVNVTRVEKKNLGTGGKGKDTKLHFSAKILQRQLYIKIKLKLS